ncbi:MAG: 3-methyl-2-oxobutanoate hydroxymethyltransferase [Thermotogae bacterium]|nr:3-methyl-2-oxobutanoate hydroxymethyltransferase [Thermotogota bacterium]
MKRITVKSIVEMKGERRITAITAYDYTSALLADAAGFDVVLVGDSAAMVIHGYDSTLPIGMEEMSMHVRVVARVVKRALVVADMPFMSYQASESEALKNAGRFMKLGASAVKVEGGREVAPLVAKMVAYGIPVMGHIGMNPQKFNIYGGFRLQGRDKEELLKDALALQDAGAFSIVLEKVPTESAKYVSERLRVPTIGIGAGPYTDGQILVFHDVLGLIPGLNFKFVRRYLNGYEIMKEALERFREDVLNGNFPSPEESYD